MRSIIFSHAYDYLRQLHEWQATHYAKVRKQTFNKRLLLIGDLALSSGCTGTPFVEGVVRRPQHPRGVSVSPSASHSAGFTSLFVVLRLSRSRRRHFAMTLHLASGNSHSLRWWTLLKQKKIDSSYFLPFSITIAMLLGISSTTFAFAKWTR